MIKQLNQSLDPAGQHHLGLVSAHSGEDARSVARFLNRLYVPLVTIALVFLVGNWLALRSKFDPLTIAQNRRLRFQSAAGEEIARIDALTPAEASAATEVVENGFKEGSGSDSLLFLGNSQSMAIMDKKPGDLTIPQWLQIMLLRHGGAQPAPQVVLGSLPNQSMAEYLITLVTAAQWRRHPIHTVIGSITLREWRGLAVRDSVQSWAAAPDVRNALSSLIAANPDLRSADAAIEGSIKPGQAGNGPSTPAQSEKTAARLEREAQNLAAKIPLLESRTYIYLRIHVFYMNLRNRLLAIHTDTPRPIPEPTYQASLQLLELSVRYAQSRGLNLVLYLAPVRPIQPNPTLPSDLAKFRENVVSLCVRYHLTCVDYSDLVPERLWTDYPTDRAQGEAGERDYAHFTGPAHKLVAQRMMADAGSRLEPVRQAPR